MTATNFVTAAFGKLVSALRGDKHMVGAYPAARSDRPGAAVEGDTNTGER